jgi:hypothetical protein
MSAMEYPFVPVHISPWWNQGWVRFFAEGRALHASRTLVTLIQTAPYHGA